MRNVTVISALLSLSILLSATTMAEDGSWMLRARIINIHTQQKNDVAPGVLADSLKVSNETLPEFDITYFFNKYVSTELILALPIKHDVSSGNTKIGTLKELPPTMTLQYHPIPNSPVNPYLGLGATYLRTWNTAISSGTLGLDRSNIGPVTQVGLDYKLAPGWYLNADLKKIWMDVGLTQASTNGARLTTLRIDPIIYGVGLGYHF